MNFTALQKNMLTHIMLVDIYQKETILILEEISHIINGELNK